MMNSSKRVIKTSRNLFNDANGKNNSSSNLNISPNEISNTDL